MLLEKIAIIFQAIERIFFHSKPSDNELIVSERAEKKDIKNQVRKAKADVKTARLNRRLNRIKDKSK